MEAGQNDKGLEDLLPLTINEFNRRDDNLDPRYLIRALVQERAPGPVVMPVVTGQTIPEPDIEPERLDVDMRDDQRRLEQKRERNREAARRVRVKRTEKEDSLKLKVNEEECHRDTLQKEVANLQKELEHLKQVLSTRQCVNMCLLPPNTMASRPEVNVFSEEDGKPTEGSELSFFLISPRIDSIEADLAFHGSSEQLNTPVLPTPPPF